MARFNPDKYSPQLDSSVAVKDQDKTRIVLQVKEGSCLSGSGRQPKGKGARFAPGGDAQLKGKLIRAHLTGTEIVYIVDGKKQSPEKAMAIAKEHGWEKFLTDASAREKVAKAERERKAKERQAAADARAAESKKAQEAKKAPAPAPAAKSAPAAAKAPAATK